MSRWHHVYRINVWVGKQTTFEGLPIFSTTYKIFVKSLIVTGLPLGTPYNIICRLLTSMKYH